MPLPSRFPPIDPKFPHFLHGGDYNPEQWIRTPEVWDEDMRLFKAANCNAVSLGIFSWVSLEPEEGRFTFDWLDRIMDKLTATGIRVIMATPTGAKPAWMAHRYAETLRVDALRRRQLWGVRHNHCFTSPVYREKSALINAKLAERYGGHPALSIWHVNNEYSEGCHCPLCQDAFRNWLRRRYHDNLDSLNLAWWSAFWSHTITDWNYIESPSPIGEMQVHGLNLDWKRFITDQTIDFFKAESAPLRQIAPHVPVTTNFIGLYDGLDYYKIARELDVVSWDSYPAYHDRANDVEKAVQNSFLHNQRRAMLQKPFLLMESSPGIVNYHPVAKLKRPQIHLVENLQAIAHGADSVLYFQWRKSRGSVEKFHGAVVDHFATEQTRTFQDVARLGAVLQKLDDVIGTAHQAEVGIIYDYETRWAIDDAAGPRIDKRNYAETCCEHYRPFWSAGVSTDIISADADFQRYKLLIAPMLYMIRPGVAERLIRFVENGGTLVTTYYTGIANESDLCFLNGFPGPLRELTGIWAEELDALYDDESVPVVPVPDRKTGLSGTYQAGILCDVIHAESAQVLATYGGEFYAGRPALTVNACGNGHAYHIASRNEPRFQTDFYENLIHTLRLRRALGVTLPPGVMADRRTDGKREFIFLLSFSREENFIELGAAVYRDLLSGRRMTVTILLPKHGAMILEPV